MQYKVPQNIDIEDRVIGPLTLRQFMIILGGVMITILIRGLLPFLPGAVFLFLGMFVVGGAAFMAFYRYNDKPLEVFLIEVSKSMIQARVRVWKKEDWNPNAHPIIQYSHKKEDATVHKSGVKEMKSELDRLAHLVDSGGFAGQPEPTLLSAVEVHVVDALAATETPKESLVSMLAEAKNDVEKKITTTKTEPKISQLASISPFANIPGYNKKDISDAEVNKILKQIREREEQNVAALSQAHVRSFHPGAQYETE